MKNFVPGSKCSFINKAEQQNGLPAENIGVMKIGEPRLLPNNKKEAK